MGRQIFDRTRKILGISLIVLFFMSIGVALASGATQGSAQSTPEVTPAQSCDYGVDTCIQGYVWREAKQNDHVCVRPEVRAQTRIDNALAAQRRNPGGGAYGPNTCISGYVWREAFPGDLVCVTPETRAQAAQDNYYGQWRYAPECRDTITKSGLVGAYWNTSAVVKKVRIPDTWNRSSI